MKFFPPKARHQPLRFLLCTILWLGGCRAADSGSNHDVGEAGDLGVADGQGDVGVADAQRDVGPPPLSDAEIGAFEEYCRALESIYQDWRDRCRPWSPGELAPRCFEAYEQVVQRRLALRDERVQPCLDALANSSCTSSFPLDVRECVDVLQPLVPNGESCTPSFAEPDALHARQCADGWCDEESCPGVCRPYGELDERCDATGEPQCAPGLWCSDGRCARRVSAGGACDVDDACVEGLQCLPGTGLGDVAGTVSEPRTCEEPLEIGEACDPALDLCRHESACIDGVCSAHLRPGDDCGVNRGHAVCPFNHFCMRTLSRDEICTLQGSQDGCSDDAWCLPGDACDRGGGVNRCTDVREPCWANSDCEAGQWCNGKDFDASQGACAPAGVLEAPCLSLVDPTADCDEGLLCIDGECTRVAQSGESCNQPGTVCEAGLTCRSGVCGPPAEQGEACDAGECGEGLGCGCVDLWGTSCTCEPRKPLGESCFVFDECESRVCDGFDRNGGPGTCQPGFCAL